MLHSTRYPGSTHDSRRAGTTVWGILLGLDSGTCAYLWLYLSVHLMLYLMARVAAARLCKYHSLCFAKTLPMLQLSHPSKFLLQAHVTHAGDRVVRLGQSNEGLHALASNEALDPCRVNKDRQHHSRRSPTTSPYIFDCALLICIASSWHTLCRIAATSFTLLWPMTRACSRSNDRARSVCCVWAEYPPPTLTDTARRH